MGASEFATMVKRGGVLIFALMAFVVVGCGGSGTGGSTGSSSSPPKRGGTLRISLGEEIVDMNPFTSLDPSGIGVAGQITEPLFQATPEGDIEPWLATGMDASADKTKWTIHIRQGVKFSDGQPLTAADVVFSLDTVRKAIYTEQIFEPISDVKATSDQTVAVITSKPFPALPALLTSPHCAIVPDEFGGKSEKEFAQNLVGTGPFKMGTWKHGESLTVERNPWYWQKGKPYLDQVVFAAAAKDSSRTEQLKGGSLDTIAQPVWSQLTSLEQEPALRVEVDHEAWTDSLLVNVRKPLFKNLKIREALKFAVNRESVVKAGLGGAGQPAGSWIAPAIDYWDEGIQAPDQDVEKAIKLVEEASAETGEKPSFTLVVNSEEAYATTSAQILQQNFAEAGFDVKLKTIEGAIQIEEVINGKYDASIVGIYSTTPDPSENVGFYVSTESFFTGGDTADATAAAKSAAAQPNSTKREQQYDEIQQEIAGNLYVIPMNYRPFTWAMKDSVLGFKINFSNVPLLQETGFSE